MAQAKKKTATRTAKKTTATRAKTTKQACKHISNADRLHVYIITAMGMVAGILLCIDAAFMMFFN